MIFSVAFSSILVLAAFASSTGNEFTRGTLRAALTHQPRRWALMGGKLAARVTVAAILMALALGVGAATSAIVAPAQDIDTTGWFGGDALGQAAGDYVRLLGFVVRLRPDRYDGRRARALDADRPGDRPDLVRPDRERHRRGSGLGRSLVPGPAPALDAATGHPGSIATGTAVATLAVYAVVASASSPS